jgi:HK97 family phage prohead protease
MPYFIWDESPECAGWAVVKEDGEQMSCHSSKQEAIDAMVGVSAAEGIEPGGTYNDDEDEEEIEIEQTELREVNLTPPAYMRAAARQGLRYYEEGKAGDGVVDATIREARAMAEGNVTADKWVRIRAWISRHLVDLDSPAARPDSPDYPSPGVVAHLLWGSGPSKAAARRALAYAEGVVSRMEEENEGRAKGEALSKIETRVFTNEFEVREDGDGMTLTGYAARFNEPSEPLPFIERIKPGAFKRSINSRNDIKLLWNHNTDMVLGSTRAGTLTLKEDEIGLRVVASLPDTSYGRDAKVSIQRGDVTGFSFGFTVPAGGDSWSSDGTERTLKSVRLMEVSTGVAFPAYPSTNGTAQVRGLDKVAERNNIDADALADALLKIEDGQTISKDEAEMVSRVISDLAPSEEVEQNQGDLGMLALKKKKLELLIKGI